MRYSLADYTLTVQVPDDYAQYFSSSNITIGGSGEYMDQIRIRYSSNQFAIAADNTGAWVVNKNLDRSGTVEVQLSMVADQVEQLKTLFTLYYQNDDITEGLTLTVNQTGNDTKTVCTCEDCYIQKIPDQQFSNTAADQTWTFICGRITMNVS